MDEDIDINVAVFEATTFLTPEQVKTTIPHVSTSLRKQFKVLEQDPLHWKRRIENMYNNMNRLSNYEIGLTGWRDLYYTLRKYKGKWIALIENPINEIYMRIALEAEDQFERFTTAANLAIQKAAEYNYIKLVKDLLEDDRVNPATNYNNALYMAGVKDNEEIFELLLNDPRVDPTATVIYTQGGLIIEYGAVLMAVAENLDYDLVKLLLLNPKFTERMINLAARKVVGTIDGNAPDLANMLSILITDERINTYEWIKETWYDLLDSYTNGSFPYEFYELYNLLIETPDVNDRLTDEEYDTLVELLNR